MLLSFFSSLKLSLFVVDVCLAIRGTVEEVGKVFEVREDNLIIDVPLILLEAKLFVSVGKTLSEVGVKQKSGLGNSSAVLEGQFMLIGVGESGGEAPIILFRASAYAASLSSKLLNFFLGCLLKNVYYKPF